MKLIFVYVIDCFVVGGQAIREQLVQLMFETFNVSGFYASVRASSVVPLCCWEDLRLHC